MLILNKKKNQYSKTEIKKNAINMSYDTYMNDPEIYNGKIIQIEIWFGYAFETSNGYKIYGKIYHDVSLSKNFQEIRINFIPKTNEEKNMILKLIEEDERNGWQKTLKIYGVANGIGSYWSDATHTDRMPIIESLFMKITDEKPRKKTNTLFDFIHTENVVQNPNDSTLFNFIYTENVVWNPNDSTFLEVNNKKTDSQIRKSAFQTPYELLMKYKHDGKIIKSKYDKQNECYVNGVNKCDRFIGNLVYNEGILNSFSEFNLYKKDTKLIVLYIFLTDNTCKESKSIRVFLQPSNEEIELLKNIPRTNNCQLAEKKYTILWYTCWIYESRFWNNNYTINTQSHC